MLKWKVLLVDDEKDFAITLAERLQLRGMQVITAFDAEEGLRYLAAESFDITILDVIMPGMGGLEMLPKIKARAPEIPVILLTGYGEAAEGAEGIGLGAFDYLMKPVDIDDLIKKMTAAVKKNPDND